MCQHNLPCSIVYAHCLLPGRAFASLYVLLFLEKEAEIGGRDKVQAGMFVSQIFKSVCTSEQSDQTSHFLPIDRPWKSDRTACMGTHVNVLQDFGWLVLLLYVPSQQLWPLRDGQFT